LILLLQRCYKNPKEARKIGIFRCMGFKRPLVQIQSLGPESDGKRVKTKLFRHFYFAKMAANFAEFSPITTEVTTRKKPWKRNVPGPF
jgi:hypothetical protein